MLAVTFQTHLGSGDESGLVPDGRHPMPAPTQSSTRNRLLQTLSADSFASLLPDLEAVDLPLRMDLDISDQPTAHIHFLESGLGSIVASSIDGEQIEVGHVGREGMSGTHVLLGVDRTPNRTFMQVAGTGLRIHVRPFREALDDDVAMNAILLRYLQTYVIQLSHSALANGRYKMHTRLARWLLMSQDRLDCDDVPLTHDFLSLMLGVRRSGVTSQIHVLEGAGVIRATRGHLRILDRPGLEAIAGGAYGLPEREYERLVATRQQGSDDLAARM